jgi:membrane-bound lytic murein transglycosylase B
MKPLHFAPEWRKASFGMLAPRIGSLVVMGLVVCAASGSASASSVRGWGYLVDKLVVDGVPRGTAERAFTDPRVPPFDGLTFSLRPGESHAMYRGLLSHRSVSDAYDCFAEHRAALRRVERETGVSGDVVAAILHVESRCGRYTGNQVVLWRLARLAMAAEPQNMRRNASRHVLLQGPRAALDVERTNRERARYLEATFYPEVRAAFEIADRLRIDPLGLRGSIAGAFGLPQFLPTSYLKFGTDGDADGRVSLYDPEDAVASCARYLQANGWQPGIDRAAKRRVIWTYNRSTPYIDTVLALADRLPQP